MTASKNALLALVLLLGVVVFGPAEAAAQDAAVLVTTVESDAGVAVLYQQNDNWQVSFCPANGAACSRAAISIYVPDYPDVRIVGHRGGFSLIVHLGRYFEFFNCSAATLECAVSNS